MTRRCVICATCHAPACCRLCMCDHDPGEPKCTATPRAQRWPTKPLVDAVGGIEKANRMLDAGNLHRATQTGLTDTQADHWALRCGLHPLEVWGWAWVDAALRPIDAIHAREGWRPAWLDTPTTQEPAA